MANWRRTIVGATAVVPRWLFTFPFESTLLIAPAAVGASGAVGTGKKH